MSNIKTGGRIKKMVKRKLPITQWLPLYTFSKLFQDLLAGLTVGMAEIPQAMGYAAIAGLPPEYGLYSGLLDGFIYAILGGCKDLNVGPSSILSLMVQPSVTKFGPLAAPLLTFLSGSIIFLLGVMHLGFITSFFSYPVVAGFVSSGCFLVGCSQLKSMFGISGKSDTVVEIFESIVNNYTEFRPWDAALGIALILVLVALKEVQVFLPRNFLGRFMFYLCLSRCAFVLILGTIISFCLHDKNLFLITGNVTAGFPQFEIPSFYILPDLAPGYGLSIAVIPFMSILEVIATTKAFNKGSKLDSTQEMLALGFCNIIGSFVGSMPVTGSFSRSAINNASGVRTTLGGVFTSTLLILVIAFLTPAFYYVPKASLCAVLISATMYLFDFKAFILFWKTKRTDYIPFLTSFFVGIFLSLEYGILLGAAVNLLFILYGTARPQLHITEQKIPNSYNERVTYTITPKDTLYFPAAEFLQDKAVNFQGNNVTVIINGKYINSVDVTVAKSIAGLTSELLLRNQNIFFIDFKDSVIKICVEVDKKLKDYFITEEEYQIVIKDQQIPAVVTD